MSGSSAAPPGPRQPGVVSLYRTQRHTQEVLESAHERYGDLFAIRLIRGKMIVFVSEPTLVEQVFTADSTVLVGDAGIEVLVGGHSVLVANGREHTAGRALLRPPFHADHIQHYREAMEHICQEELAGWPTHEPVALLPRLESVTLGVIVIALFGEGASLGALGARFHDLLAYREKPIAAAMINVMPRGSSPPKKFARLRRAFDTEVLKAIQAARRDPRLDEREDILSMLARTTREDGSRLSDWEIRDHVTTLLVQGHVSTATAIAWAIERLVRHPGSLERLIAELETGTEDYLDAVIMETLRLRPPVPVVAREVAQPYEIGGYEIEAGKLIACNAFSLHRRRDLYPEPLAFRPERFLESPPGPYTWIPFGGGGRHCIGRSFATMEMKVVLRAILDRFHLAPARQGDERTKRRGIGWIPADGAEVVLEKRA